MPPACIAHYLTKLIQRKLETLKIPMFFIILNNNIYK